MTTVTELLDPKQQPLAAGRYHHNKRETLESFLAFLRGEALPRWPLEIFLELSNVCDLKCAMCPTFSALNPHRFLALRETERGFLEAEKHLTPLTSILAHALSVHCFGYGEPTLHPEFREFIATVAEYEAMIDFFTNGMHLTADLADFLVDQRVASVTVSFSGTTAEQYENVYLGGDFEQVLCGIAHLAEAKERLGSPYPLIEINSLGFEHHIQNLEEFVGLMADHGANIIHVKSLLTHSFIPQLAGHASIYRSWNEGEIVARAFALAKERGVSLSAEQYLRNEAKTEEEWQQMKNRQAHPTAGEGPSELVSIGSWREISKGIEPIRPETLRKAATTDEPVEIPPAALRSVYRVAPPRQTAAEPFYCAEPFKTMYIRRNGAVKPCCFSADFAPPLGNISKQDGRGIWMGERYEMVRDSILRQEYPLALCGNCLRSQVGPQDHYSHGRIRHFLNWYESGHGFELIPFDAAEIEALGGNYEVFKRYLEHHPHQGVPSAAQAVIPDAERKNPPALVDELNRLHDESADIHGHVRGHLDRYSAGRLLGWAQATQDPDLKLWVALYDGETCIGYAQANRYRNDLRSANVGNGCYGFEFTLPASVRDGKHHSFFAKIEGTSITLRGDPLLAVVGASTKSPGASSSPR